MVATASRPDNIESGCHSSSPPVGETARTETGPSSVSSLLMMRRAFAGLRADPSAISAITEQRDEPEFPVTSHDGLGRQPDSFIQEKSSFEAVSESYGLSLRDATARRGSAKGSSSSLDADLGGGNEPLHSLDPLDAPGLSG
jgi:hypothetical protein